MEHDFFTANPVKGANAYYMRAIIHGHFPFAIADNRLARRRMHKNPGKHCSLHDWRFSPLDK
jgi:hypothetical protein